MIYLIRLKSECELITIWISEIDTCKLPSRYKRSINKFNPIIIEI